MVLPMSSSAPVSTVLAQLSGYWIWDGSTGLSRGIFSSILGLIRHDLEEVAAFFYSRVLPDLCVVETRLFLLFELNQQNVSWCFPLIFVPFCMKIIPP
jgi:hypothetical protein